MRVPNPWLDAGFAHSFLYVDFYYIIKRTTKRGLSSRYPRVEPSVRVRPFNLQKGTECDQSAASVHLMTGSPMRMKPSLQAYCTVSPTSSRCCCGEEGEDDDDGPAVGRGRRRRPWRGGSGGGQWIAAAGFVVRKALETGCKINFPFLASWHFFR